MMTTLHIVPGDAAEHSISQAIRGALTDHEMLKFPDDLSCGPIASDDFSVRAAWWKSLNMDIGVGASLHIFWDRVEKADGRLIVWFGCYSASELAFFLAWADRIEARRFDVIDVTDLILRRRDGSPVGKARAVGTISPDGFLSLFGSERPIDAQESSRARRRWRELKAENASLRVVESRNAPSVDLVSKPDDYFDQSILQHCTKKWTKVAL